MSAQAQLDSLSQHITLYGELDAMRAISRDAALAKDAAGGLEEIAGSILRVAGIRAVQILPAAGATEDRSRASQRGHSGTPAFAIAPIALSGCLWGEVRIEFDPTAFDLKSPVRFASYCGQQIAGMLRCIQLMERGRILEETVSGLRRTLATRKTAQRAAGILAQAYELSEKEALALLIQQSRESSRPVHCIAEQIISSHRVVVGLPARK